MITREILNAQLELYLKSRQQAAGTLEKAKADFNAFVGAVDACQTLLRILDQLGEVAKVKS